MMTKEEVSEMMRQMQEEFTQKMELALATQKANLAEAYTETAKIE